MMDFYDGLTKDEAANLWKFSVDHEYGDLQSNEWLIEYLPKYVQEYLDMEATRFETLVTKKRKILREEIGKMYIETVRRGL